MTNSLSGLRGNNSRLVAYDFTSFENILAAKLDYERKTSEAFDTARELQNMSDVTQDYADCLATKEAKTAANQYMKNWIDYVKQAEAHFKERYFNLTFFSVLAQVILSTPEMPDELEGVAKSAQYYRDGREGDNGRYYGANRFNSLNHYMSFVDQCIENNEALDSLPAVSALMQKIEARKAKDADSRLDAKLDDLKAKQAAEEAKI